MNTAIALARLAVPVHFWAKVGADEAGDLLRSQLQQAGVGVERYEQQPALVTKTAVVLIDRTGERSFLRTPGGGNALALTDFESQSWQGIDYLHIGGCYSLRRLLGPALAAALQMAHAHGVTTFLDTVWSSDGNWSALLPALPYIDHLLPSLAEAQAISGEVSPAAIAGWLHEHGAKTVVIKLGAEGAYLSTATVQTVLGPSPVPGQIVDATGAGDAFCAGYIAAVRAGHPLLEAVRWGNAWGAAAVSAIGATAGLVDRSQLLAILAAS